MGKITATNAKYIKLGPGGSEIEEICLKKGTLAINFNEVKHSEGDDHNKIYDIYYKKKRKEGMKEKGAKVAATRHAKEVTAFYEKTEKDRIWITFANGLMYWCKAKNVVIMLDKDDDTYKGEMTRTRKAIGGWRSTNMKNEPLRLERLSGNLTKTMGYRATICNVHQDMKYLLAKINGDEIDIIKKAKEAKDKKLYKEMLESAEAMMKMLHWKDFELFVDLVFARVGWQRISALGGSQKTIDFSMILPRDDKSGKDEYAIVQVKSSTDQGQLDYYIEESKKRSEASGENEKMFYVYHTAKSNISTENENVELMDAKKLSELTIGTESDKRLFDWLLRKI